jgi:hypothetical protein
MDGKSALGNKMIGLLRGISFERVKREEDSERKTVK